MKQGKKIIAVLLALMLALSGLALGWPSRAVKTLEKSASPLFRAQFEGDRVAGTAELVDGL